MAFRRPGNSHAVTLHDVDFSPVALTGVRSNSQDDGQGEITGSPVSSLNTTELDLLPNVSNVPPTMMAPRNSIDSHVSRTSATSSSSTETFGDLTLQANVSTTNPANGQPSVAPFPTTPSQAQPLHVQSTSSNTNTAPQLPPPPPPKLFKQQLRRVISRWNDRWLIEVGAGALSIICLAAIIAILAHFDGEPLTKWHSKITPNAMISVLATVSKSSVLLPVAECISQLTWLRFQKPHTLQLIQEFDEASRGALGSFQILFSTEAVAAWFGAIITLTALAFEPFIQQVLLLKSREVLLNNTSTAVPVSTVFNTGKTRSVSFPVNYYPLGDPSHSLDPTIRAAGFDGIYSISITPPYNCGASTCRFKSFKSLAICSKCTDVLAQLQSGCNQVCSIWTYTTPANISIQARYESGARIRNVFATLFNSSANNRNDFDMPTVAEFATLKLNVTQDYTPVPASAYDCSLRLCIKTWNGASFQNSEYEETAPTEIDFQKVTHAEEGQKPFSILEIDPSLNATRFGTYKINFYDWQMMTDFLAAQFSYHGGTLPSNTDDQGVPIMLYETEDMPSMIDKLANSLTNMIRTSDDSFFVAGEAFQGETFIHIQWPWISLPVLVVLSSNLLLGIIIVQT